MLQAVSLRGRLAASGLLRGKVAGIGSLVGKMSMPVGYVDYSGSYDITPKVTAQVLQTKDKHMTDDVTIKKIPYFDVSNDAGGSTVYIANEV